jgi:regulator of protease activity HflC (stomatin/prohibitin superfamily)
MKVNDIYQKYGMTYESNVIAPIVRETVKSISAQYTAEELVTKRTIFSDNISRVLAERLTEKDAIMERFNVVNFEFSQSFNQAIEAKVTAEQNALAAKNKLEQVKFEAQQQIEQAKGKAEAINVEANALQDNPQVLQLRSLEKWNGVLPQFLGGSSPIPFININQ